ncbi:histidine kinase [Litoribacter ruber]|uniref:histidine kinase n=1 Tax=Litoribacter ruber TaxID=702568 RepID=A0AAP2CKI6_9BACT|nr:MULTISPECIES: ATP-binding protein [Litoribacter]MBS9525827.1 histidine kinase [Litoribacter alkaliphilus]MBT0810450.1 histidine kinase [Litoribacter ruber]
MNVEIIVAIILISYLRTSSLTYEVPLRWKKTLKWGLIVSITVWILDVSTLLGDVFGKVLSILLVGAVIYAILRFKELDKGRQLVFAWLPLLLLSLIIEVVEFIFPQFYKRWDDYFLLAIFCAIAWGIAMWINNNRQRKALEREKIKSLAREQEFKATEQMKIMLERQVRERTSALTQQKEELEKTLEELKSTQAQLIHAEKMASLGELTAGIAHEIQNPLNFVNNFSEVSSELLDEMKEELQKGDIEEVKVLVEDIKLNLEKINHHGKRADAIVKGMLMHSRNNSEEKSLTDINALAEEYLRLSYHGLRAKDKSFNASFKLDLHPDLPSINIVPQDIGRVFLNLINNAFYAVNQQAKNLQEKGIQDYTPKVEVATALYSDHGRGNVMITIRDNGIGIPQAIKAKIFQPFFTTKPTGEGTGLGLSLSYDIIKAHGGNLEVGHNDSNDQFNAEIGLEESCRGTVFTITLPYDNI